VAIVIAALLFTAHHVIALSAWVGPPLVVLGSVGVFLGALIWSAIYARERSIWPCYFSHILADLAILLIAYDLLFRPG
jgi:membrane protease YdiL (CAAX protease family)